MKRPSGQACIIPVFISPVIAPSSLWVKGLPVSTTTMLFAHPSYLVFLLYAPINGFYILVIFSKDSDFGLGRIMQRSPHTRAYHTHFFVLSMIFMQIPTVPYLCSQLATGTKGLCKQLQQANRFHPLQKNH